MIGEKEAPAPVTTLSIPRAIYDAVRAHGEEAYPLECCGVLLGYASGDGWRVVKAVRAENATVSGQRSRYEIAPAELVRIIRDARRQGLEIAGFYHSHPDSTAHWSATDLAEAHWLGASYVITEVAAGKAGQTCSFRLAGAAEEDKRFEAERIDAGADGD